MDKEINNYLCSKIAAQKDFQPDWQAHRYLLKDKMFAMHARDKQGQELLTLKLAPERGQELRELYPDQIMPGYYMNKVHWNSILLEKIQDWPASFIKGLIDESHQLVLGAFSKKVQAELVNS